MILSYPSLRRHEGKFEHFSGITVAEFDALYQRFEPAWTQAEQERLQQRERQRAIGGGGDYHLALDTRLLMCLVWMRHYLTTEAVGYLFGVSQSTASRNLTRLLPVLEALAQETFHWPTPKRGRRSLRELQHAESDLLAILDATEQSVNKPHLDAQARLHFSGKQRRYTCKSALRVNEEGMIRQVTPTSPGSIHDVTHVRQAGLLAHLPPDAIAVADAAFVGIYQDLPNHGVLVPYKAYRNHPLVPEQRYANRFVARLRIKVENVFAALKRFRILTHRFRHAVARVHSQVFTIIAGLHNQRTFNRLMQATKSA